MRNARLIMLAFMISSVFRFVLFDAAEAAGPWKAQVVSAETKQPLEGVVVLAFWTKHVRSFGGPSLEYHASQETITGTDGRFTIAPRSFFSLNPLVFFRGPSFLLFKPGYGEDRWLGYEGSEGWSNEKRKALSTYAQLLQLDGIVIEMPRLRSIEQRREYLMKLRPDYLTVPREKAPLLENAIVEERRALGYRSRIHP